MIQYPVAEVRRTALYRVESDQPQFLEYADNAIAEDQMVACKVRFNERDGIKVVIDVRHGDKTQTYISDGAHVFTEDKKRCRPIDDEFKDKFRIKPFGQ
jgi:hypothetical protein